MSESRIIPKRMAFFWHGPMSWLRYTTLLSFCKLHPDWDVHLFAPAEPPSKKYPWKTNIVDDRDYAGKDYRPLCAKLPIKQNVWQAPSPDLPAAQLCDIFQWQLLGEAGGFYADLDILWLKSLEPLRLSLTNVDAVFCLEAGSMAIGFHASSDYGCNLFADLYAYSQTVRGDSYQTYGTELVTRFGRQLNIRSRYPRGYKGAAVIADFRRKYTNVSIEVVPDAVVYPFTWQQIPDIFDKVSPIPDNTFGIHWFGGSPLATKWSYKLTPGWSGEQNTLTGPLVELAAKSSQYL